MIAIQRPGYWWLPAAIRIVILGQVLAVALAAATSGLIWALIPLTAFATMATVLEYRSPRSMTAALLEGVASGLWIGLNPAANVLLTYLVVPGFSTGLRLGRAWALRTVAATAVTVSLAEVVRGFTDTEAQLLSLALWLVTALALSLVAAWGRDRLDSVPGPQAAYRAAARLLGELSEIGPQLNGSLDLDLVARRLLDDLDNDLPVERSAVVIERTEPGTPLVVAFQGLDHSWVNHGTNEEVRQEWGVDLGDIGRGMVVLESSRPLTIAERVTAAEIVRYHEPRMQAASAFAEVWESATQEERLRLAREIHDGIAQDLASLAYVADDAAEDAQSEADRSAIEALRDSIRMLVGELRRSVFDLRSGEQQPLALTVSDLARRTAQMVGLDLNIRVAGAGELHQSVVEQRRARL